MKTITFRTLTPADIECRVGSGAKEGSKGFTLLLYKTARTDANILDKSVGCFNWQKRFYQVKNTMICSLGINMNYDDEYKDPYWVFKDDAGDESNTEAVKGEASDSFKRAGFAFGIGRELYTSPFIYISADKGSFYDKYSVKEIGYNENREINKLVIINEKTKQVVYTYGVSNNLDKALIEKLESYNINLKQVCAYLKKSYSELTNDDLKMIIAKKENK